MREKGAVVKTIGDAVMATFIRPEHAIVAGLRMRAAMAQLNAERGREELIVKIGIHEGPCLAVMLNERQDYFGQTVNIASRVQSLSTSQEIHITGPVMKSPAVGFDPSETGDQADPEGSGAARHRRQDGGVRDTVRSSEITNYPANRIRHARPCAGHPRLCGRKKDVDGRVKPGHDGGKKRYSITISPVMPSSAWVLPSLVLMSQRRSLARPAATRNNHHSADCPG